MKKLGILAIGIVIGNAITTQKYNNISDKLDKVIEVTDEENIDSLYQVIMDIGWKNDSMVLKHDEGWKF
tara:strand:- start:8 stop:214 length:207 start_codon:yes stop_codon:yes gene_type:complete